MSYLKRIVCLANSYKTGGLCIVGREIVQNGFGNWVRPVSNRPTAEVSFLEYRYADNTSPRLLDIIDIPLLNPQPRQHQTENHVVDRTQRWVVDCYYAHCRHIFNLGICDRTDVLAVWNVSSNVWPEPQNQVRQVNRRYYSGQLPRTPFLANQSTLGNSVTARTFTSTDPGFVLALSSLGLPGL